MAALCGGQQVGHLQAPRVGPSGGAISGGGGGASGGHHTYRPPPPLVGAPGTRLGSGGGLPVGGATC